MPADQRQWPFLRGKTAGRLRFFSRERRDAVVVACRLPGCAQPVERSGAAGRTRWFHSRRCADDFRTQQRAIDAAIDELATNYESTDYPPREKVRMRSDLEWLLDVRTTYASPGSWRDPAIEGREVRSTESVDRFIADVHSATAKPQPADPCPTCRGTGDLSAFRAPPPSEIYKRQRAATDTLAEIATLLGRLRYLRPSISVVEAADQWEQLALDAERDLQRSLTTTGASHADEQ